MQALYYVWSHAVPLRLQRPRGDSHRLPSAPGAATVSLPTMTEEVESSPSVAPANTIVVTEACTPCSSGGLLLHFFTTFPYSNHLPCCQYMSGHRVWATSSSNIKEMLVAMTMSHFTKHCHRRREAVHDVEPAHDTHRRQWRGEERFCVRGRTRRKQQQQCPD